MGQSHFPAISFDINDDDDMPFSAGMDVLLRAVGKCGPLEILGLSQCMLSPDTVGLLVDSLVKPTCRVWSLDLSGCDIHTTNAVDIRRLLSSSPMLRKLDLSYNNFNSEGGSEIAKGIERSQVISELDLSGNDLRIHGIVAVAAALRVSRSLTKLDLSENNEVLPSLEFAWVVSAVVQCGSLKSLQLDPDDVQRGARTRALDAILEFADKKINWVSTPSPPRDGAKGSSYHR